MNTNDASSFQMKPGREKLQAATLAAGEGGICYLSLCIWNINPRQSPGKMGRPESSPTYIAGALPGGAGGLVPHGSRGLSLLCFYFL